MKGEKKELLTKGTRMLFLKGLLAGVISLISILRFTVSTSASEMEMVEPDRQESTEESTSTDAVFNLKLSVPDGFKDEIQFLFISEDGNNEYESSLNSENSYNASFVAVGNTTYRLLYYYDSYEIYEIEELKEEYVCNVGTLWNLEYNVIERVTPVQKKLVPLGGDMTPEEAEAVEKASFTSTAFPGMSDEDVADWYYGEVKKIVALSEDNEFYSITSGINNQTTEEYFKEYSGTDEEWNNITDDKLIAFYYACVLPNIIIENNDFDYDSYIENLNILNTLCTNIGYEELYDTTYKLWDYIWQYQRSEKKLPNFSTYLMTDFRAEVNTVSATEIQVKESKTIDEGDEPEKMNIFVKYLKEHWLSVVLLIFGGGILAVFYYTRKREEKGKVKR